MEAYEVKAKLRFAASMNFDQFRPQGLCMFLSPLEQCFRSGYYIIMRGLEPLGLSDVQ